MATISQTITALPEAGHRGVDARDTFVAKQEAFQDAIQGTTVSQLNNFATQANAVRNEVNTLTTTATTKASEANTSASNAATSAATATTKASEASAARDAALNALDNFDDRYLRSKASNPTLDNDGNALLEGALYWNSTSKGLKIWTGTVWQDTTNPATNLGITAGTTAGPIVTSSTGTNATLPTASASASGVVTTGAQSWAGVKTFTSSPIVPTPTTDFQATPVRGTNITVTVGSGGQYSTINAALEYLSGFYPLHKTAGVTATINLLAGFVMAEQVLVRGLNLGWITITGVDAETNITHTALTTDFTTGDYGFASYPAFGVSKGGALPVINQLFNMNLGVSGASSNKHGVLAIGAGSSANIASGKGVKNVGSTGILADNGSTINAIGANASGAGSSGIYADNGSTINASSANASSAGSFGIYAANGSTINASSANASSAGGNGISSYYGSIVNASSANASSAGSYGIVSYYGSIVNARSVNASSAGSYGIIANEASTINARNAIIQNQSSANARISVLDGSHIEASGINTTGGTSTVLSQTANTLTSRGIIYQ